MPSTNQVEFKKHPEKVICSNCSFYDYTRVEDKINSEGWLWCILCCCCGIWLLSFLVKCMDGFREFHHYCARCGKKLATYRPKFSSGSIILLIILAFLAVTLIGFACYFRMNGGRRMHWRKTINEIVMKFSIAIKLMLWKSLYYKIKVVNLKWKY